MEYLVGGWKSGRLRQADDTTTVFDFMAAAGREFRSGIV